jgi:hypothetical protein
VGDRGNSPDHHDQDKGRGAKGSKEGNGHAGQQGHAAPSSHGNSQASGHATGQGNGHPNGQGNGQGNGQSNGQANGQSNGHANGQANGHAHTPGQTHGAPQAGGHAGGSGDPAGNNGTVKIAELGELDGIPNNTPHPGCTFQVEWYGFDQGPDVVSTVTFAMQAPTRDVALGVAGRTSVPVGGDAASGAGTSTGLDATEAYTLSFDGEPHPKQGYHVRLTVATPRSLGNDTKTKVFWVEPCASEPTVADETSDDGGVGSGGAVPESGTPDSLDQGVLGISADAPAEPAASAASAARDGSSAPDAAVPTAVDAGESGSVLPEWARSPLPLTLVAFGLVLAAVGIVRRNTSRA